MMKIKFTGTTSTPPFGNERVAQPPTPFPPISSASLAFTNASIVTSRGLTICRENRTYWPIHSHVIFIYHGHGTIFTHNCVTYSRRHLAFKSGPRHRNSFPRSSGHCSGNSPQGSLFWSSQKHHHPLGQVVVVLR